MEKIICDGPEALNAFISSGEVEELNDVMPQQEDTDNSRDDEDDSNAKRPRFDRNTNHNAQVIYANDTNTSIPSLLQLNVKGEASSTSQPPSLLNLNVAPPPFDDVGGNWQRQDEKPRSQRRNRDRDGNRISRFDRDGGSGGGGGNRSGRYDNNERNNRRNGSNRRRI